MQLTIAAKFLVASILALGIVGIASAIPNSPQSQAKEKGVAGYAHVNATMSTAELDNERTLNVTSMFSPGDGIFCFDLPFTPRNVVATIDVLNSVGTNMTDIKAGALSEGSGSACDTETQIPYDAVVQTFYESPEPANTGGVNGFPTGFRQSFYVLFN
jgi:hypothetical protein